MSNSDNTTALAENKVFNFIFIRSNTKWNY